jgi:hypothetical protein
MERHQVRLVKTVLISILLGCVSRATAGESLRLNWADNYLTASSSTLPGGTLRVLYIEAYCRSGSTDRDWAATMIGHTTKLISRTEGGTRLELQCTLHDGVFVRHVIQSSEDEIDFRIAAHNPTHRDSEADWAQPCVEVDRFTGGDKTTYLNKCFIFLDGRLTRLPTPDWATKARYTPGQVWCPRGVPRSDANPRPLSDLVPSNGLIGCYSADERRVLAIAFEPYQELFQGVRACIHADFRIGGLKAGESKQVRGKIYVVRADINALLKRYAKDFPEHVRKD